MKNIAVIGNRIEYKIFTSYVKSTSQDIRFVNIDNRYQTVACEWVGFINLGGLDEVETLEIIGRIKVGIR